MIFLTCSTFLQAIAEAFIYLLETSELTVVQEDSRTLFSSAWLILTAVNAMLQGSDQQARTAEAERPIPAILSEQFSQGGISARSSEGRHSDSDAVPRKPAVPRHTDMAKLNPRSHRNHIIENRRQADRLLPPSASRAALP